MRRSRSFFHRVEGAVEIILKYSKKEAVQRTLKSLQAVEDFILTARLQIALLEKGYEDLEVECHSGTAVVTLNKAVTRLEHYTEKVKETGHIVEGVRSVEVKVGSGYHQPSILSTVEFELPKKVLLVDDGRTTVTFHL